MTELVREHNPKTIIETGTFQGRGTTAAVCEGIKTLKNKCVFYSIESNPYNYKTAVENLKSDGNLSYVEVLNGISLPRGILPAIDEIRENTADENIKSDIFVDYPKSMRAECYFNETNYPALPDDLLGECLKKCDYKPDIVILDSAGHLGFIEFKYVVEALRGNCIVVLDDTLHIKHSKSLELIKTDKRFKIIVESDEKFGFCIASFTP